MRKDNATFITKFISEAGSYLINSDYFAFVELKDYACYVIADGIDIDEKKESAKLAITTVITKFSENPGMSAGKLKQYMKAAHQILLEEAEEMRLEASMAILLTDYKKAMWAHVGNCRLYWMRNGNIKLATKDTSLTQKMVDDEELAIDQLAYHEERNNLYTYLGQPGRFTPVISSKKVLEDGDILMLMTRGVWENVGDAEIIDAVDGVSKAEDVCTGLEDVILSQRMEVVENYTIATVFVNKIYKNPNEGKYKKWIKIGVSLGAVLLTLFLTLFITRVQSNKSNIEKMEKYKERGIEYLQEYNYTLADEQMSQAYITSENVKAGKRSRNYAKVECVETYEKLTDNLNRGMSALQEKEYKKAAGLFQNANDLIEELKTNHEEDISTYSKGIETYLTYATNMQAGVSAYEEGDYETANSSFTKAYEVMDEIDDTTNRDIAQEYKTKVNAQISMANAKELEASGDSLRTAQTYADALLQYELAHGEYKRASEMGNVDATAKLKEIEEKMVETEACINKLSQEDQARMYEEMGDREKEAGNIDSAKEFYSQTMAIWQQLGNTEEVDRLKEKVVGTSAEASETSQDATNDLMSALEALANDDVELAKTYLNSALANYNAIKDNESAKKVKDILNKISAKQNAGN